MNVFDQKLQEIESQKVQRPQLNHQNEIGWLDIERYLTDHGRAVTKKEQNNGGTLYCLDHCIFDENHTRNESAIGQTSNGMLTYQCFHETCKGRTWADARKAISGDKKLGAWMTGGNGNHRISIPVNTRQETHVSATDAPELQQEKKTIIAPFTPEQTQVCGRLVIEPVALPCLLRYRGNPYMNRRNVSCGLAAGGTGKTTLALQAAHAWSYGNEFAGFFPEQALKILILLAEEDQEELDRKLWLIGDGVFSPNLHAQSIKGIVGPLMTLDNGAPVRTEWYDWLDQTIANHAGLDLLILDPKSRLYGLDENNNDHNTQWVACLETLTIKHDMGTHFNHHVPKNTKEISQWMGRGGGALVDACRASFGMIGMTEQEGKQLGLEDWWDYIKIRPPKVNNGPKVGIVSYLKFDEKGLLMPVDVFRERTAGMKTHFLYILAQDEKAYSRRDLNKDKPGKHISDAMKAKFPDFNRGRDIDLLLDLLLADGSLREGHGQTATRGKTVFKVLSNPENS